MVNIQLPAIANQGSDGGMADYVTTIDGSYNIYNARLIQLNVPDARNDGTHDSQAHWGLASIPSRFGQNSAWNSAYAVSTVSGAAALDIYSTTYSFARTITQIDDMSLKFAHYVNGFPNITLDETDDVIDNINLGTNTSYLGSALMRKTYIATSGGNKYVIGISGGNVETYACDAAGTITTATANDTIAIGSGSAGVIAVKDQFIRILFATTLDTGGGNYVSRLSASLYSIDSAGELTLVSGPTIIKTSGTHSSPIFDLRLEYGKYIDGNTAHVYGRTQASTGSFVRSARTYFTLDLTTTGSVAFTEVAGDTLQNNGGNNYVTDSKELATGYDGVGTRLLYIPSSENIFEADAGGFSDTTSDAVVSRGEMIQYRSSLANFQDTENNYHRTTDFYIKGVLVPGSLVGINNSMRVYEMTGTNEEDDVGALKGIMLNTPGVLGKDLKLDLIINGTTIETYDNYIGSFLVYENSSAIAIGATSIKINLKTTNIGTVDHKVGFGLTGGTYASPTGTNNMTGDANDGANVGANGSYMDLLLA